MTQSALKYDVKVQEKGRVELQLPFPVGTRVTVFVIEESTDDFDDLLLAAQSSFDFSNHSFDDDDWNNT